MAYFNCDMIGNHPGEGIQGKIGSYIGISTEFIPLL